MPDVRDRPARVQHPRDVTADMIRELETCEAFEVVGQRARDGDAPWHSGLVMPVRFVRGATRHRRRCRWKLGVLTVAVDMPCVDAQANRLTRADRQLQGANSVVFKIRVNGALFALKGILPLGQVSRDPGAESAQKLERNSSEYKAQVMLCHPSIARVRHAFDGPADLVLPWIPEVWFCAHVRGGPMAYRGVMVPLPAAHRISSFPASSRGVKRRTSSQTTCTPSSSGYSAMNDASRRRRLA